MTKLFMRMSWQIKDGRNLKELQVSKGMKHHLLATNIQDLSYQLKMKSLRLQGSHGKMHGTHCLIGSNLMRVLGRSFVRLVNQRVGDLFLQMMGLSILKFLHSKIMHVVKSTKG